MEEGRSSVKGCNGGMCNMGSAFGRFAKAFVVDWEDLHSALAYIHDMIPRIGWA